MVEEEDIVDIGVDGVEIPRTRPMDNKQVQLDESSDSVIDEEVDLDEIAHGVCSFSELSSPSAFSLPVLPYPSSL